MRLPEAYFRFKGLISHLPEAGLSTYLSCRKSMAPEMDTVITVEQTG